MAELYPPKGSMSSENLHMLCSPDTSRRYSDAHYNGAPVDGDTAMTFRLYDGSSAAAAIWEETVVVDCDQGTCTAVLGHGTSLDSLVVEPMAEPYLGVSISAGAELEPRLRVTSVPFALHAQQAAVAQDVECSGCIAATEVAFDYARANETGGAAVDLDCDNTCVGTAELDNSAVVTSKLGDGVVTTPKLADAAVTATQLADEAVTTAKLAPCARHPAAVQRNGLELP